MLERLNADARFYGLPASRAMVFKMAEAA